MNIAVIGGAGYVGLTMAACLACKGHRVYCVDIDNKKVDMINRGIPVIYEEGLERLLQIAANKKRLSATIDIERPVLDSSIIFICTGTPSKKDGSIDLGQVKSAAKSVGLSLAKKDQYSVVCIKSTVVPGTTETVIIPLLEKVSGMKAGVDFGVCMNPEFLREGSAVKDFLSPKEQGIVIGQLDKKSGDILLKVYKDIDADVFRTTIKTAEMIKYVRNCYLAKDISFVNEIANICQEFGVDFLDVKRGLEMDSRIGKGRFLNAGIGYGGSCFPKDVKALIAKAREVGIRPIMLEATLRINENQPHLLVDLIRETIGNIKNKSVAVLGLAFKPGTNDMREARSIPIIEKLLAEGAKVCVYDPQANQIAKHILKNRVQYSTSPKEALQNADVCVISTEWPAFSDPQLYSHLRGDFIFDGRRILDPKKLTSRFVYQAVGFPKKHAKKARDPVSAMQRVSDRGVK
jgi:UDPglucose 6-dehydrogenase